LLKSATGATGWIGLAATPTLALMAVISAVRAPGMPLCSAAPSAGIDDMALMYLLMSLFHLPPWLRLLSRRFASPHHPD
jgi:hypothetical protein